jgi:transcriptional regulator with XRE-family HTH domain
VRTELREDMAGFETDGRAIRLKSLRERASLRQTQLAKRSGVSAATIVRLERGRHAPRTSTIRRLAAALGVQPRDLFRAEQGDQRANRLDGATTGERAEALNELDPGPGVERI